MTEDKNTNGLSHCLNLCNCCLEDGDKDLWDLYKYDGLHETFGEKLIKCFNLKWKTTQNLYSERICSSCVKKLKHSVKFRAILEKLEIYEQGKRKHCKCCLLYERKMKNFWMPVEIDGQNKILGQKFAKCFGLNWKEPPSGKEYVCKTCIEKLQSMSSFKKLTKTSCRKLAELYYSDTDIVPETKKIFDKENESNLNSMYSNIIDDKYNEKKKKKNKTVRALNENRDHIQNRKQIFPLEITRHIFDDERDRKKRKKNKCKEDTCNPIVKEVLKQNYQHKQTQEAVLFMDESSSIFNNDGKCKRKKRRQKRRSERLKSLSSSHVAESVIDIFGTQEEDADSYMDLIQKSTSLPATTDCIPTMRESVHDMTVEIPSSSSASSSNIFNDDGKCKRKKRRQKRRSERLKSLSSSHVAESVIDIFGTQEEDADSYMDLSCSTIIDEKHKKKKHKKIRCDRSPKIESISNDSSYQVSELNIYQANKKDDRALSMDISSEKGRRKKKKQTPSQEKLRSSSASPIFIENPIEPVIEIMDTPEKISSLDLSNDVIDYDVKGRKKQKKQKRRRIKIQLSDTSTVVEEICNKNYEPVIETENLEPVIEMFNTKEEDSDSSMDLIPPSDLPVTAFCIRKRRDTVRKMSSESPSPTPPSVDDDIEDATKELVKINSFGTFSLTVESNKDEETFTMEERPSEIGLVSSMNLIQQSIKLPANEDNICTKSEFLLSSPLSIQQSLSLPDNTDFIPTMRESDHDMFIEMPSSSSTSLCLEIDVDRDAESESVCGPCSPSAESPSVNTCHHKEPEMDVTLLNKEPVSSRDLIHQSSDDDQTEILESDQKMSIGSSTSSPMELFYGFENEDIGINELSSKNIVPKSAVMDSCEQESAIMESCEQELAVMESCEQESAIMESCEQESAIMESCEQESAIMESCEQELAVMESCEQESAIMESCEQELAVMESCEQESAIMESCEQESTIMESCEQELAVMESCEQELAVMESCEQELAVMKSCEQESAVMESCEQELTIMESCEQERAAMENESCEQESVKILFNRLKHIDDESTLYNKEILDIISGTINSESVLCEDCGQLSTDAYNIKDGVVAKGEQMNVVSDQCSKDDSLYCDTCKQILPKAVEEPLKEFPIEPIYNISDGMSKVGKINIVSDQCIKEKSSFCDYCQLTLPRSEEETLKKIPIDTKCNISDGVVTEGEQKKTNSDQCGKISSSICDNCKLNLTDLKLSKAKEITVMRIPIEPMYSLSSEEDFSDVDNRPVLGRPRKFKSPLTEIIKQITPHSKEIPKTNRIEAIDIYSYSSGENPERFIKKPKIKRPLGRPRKVIPPQGVDCETPNAESTPQNLRVSSNDRNSCSSKENTGRDVEQDHIELDRGRSKRLRPRRVNVKSTTKNRRVSTLDSSGGNTGRGPVGRSRLRSKRRQPRKVEKSKNRIGDKDVDENNTSFGSALEMLSNLGTVVTMTKETDLASSVNINNNKKVNKNKKRPESSKLNSTIRKLGPSITLTPMKEKEMVSCTDLNEESSEKSSEKDFSTDVSNYSDDAIRKMRKKNFRIRPREKKTFLAYVSKLNGSDDSDMESSMGFRLKESAFSNYKKKSDCEESNVVSTRRLRRRRCKVSSKENCDESSCRLSEDKDTDNETSRLLEENKYRASLFVSCTNLFMKHCPRTISFHLNMCRKLRFKSCQPKYKWPPKPYEKPVIPPTHQPIIYPAVKYKNPPAKQLEKFIFDWRGFSQINSTFNRREEFSSSFTGSKQIFNTAYDAFTAIWDKEIMEMITDEINISREHFMTAPELKKISIDEFYVFFGILIAKSVVTNKSDFYWTSHNLFFTPGFLLMPESRYKTLYQSLNYLNVTFDRGDSHDHAISLLKLQPIVDHLNSRFSSLYVIGQGVALDQSTVSLCKPEKRKDKTVYVVDTYEICELDTGYLWKFEVQIHEDLRPPPEAQQTLSSFESGLIIRLTKDLDYQGHTIWLEERYNSPALARELKSFGIDCAGPLKTDCEFVPTELARLEIDEMVPGQILGCTSGDVDLLVWRDKFRMAFLSTYHGMETVEWGGVNKPSVMPDYLKCLSRLDRKDRVMAMFPSSKKRRQRFFNRFLYASVLNAYILYKSSNPSVTFRSFRKNLVQELFLKHMISLEAEKSQD